MGPWFALGDALGLPDVARRTGCGSGSLLALAAWGMVRLARRPLRAAARRRPRGRGAPLRPQPVRRRLREPHVGHAAGLRRAAVAAAVRPPRAARAARLGVAGGVRARAHLHRRRGERRRDGVDAARAARCWWPTSWAGAAWRAAPSCRSRCASCAATARRLRVVGAAVLVHAPYGLDFLPFTEQPGTIWGTTSLSESLRLMGFWTSYIGVGFGGELRRPPTATRCSTSRWSSAPRSLACPRCASARSRGRGAGATRPFFLALALVGLVVMVAGWPEGAPLRRAADVHLQPRAAVQFLRTTYKAGPLVALGLAGLGGAARVAGAAGAPAPRRAALRPRRGARGGRRLAAGRGPRARAPARPARRVPPRGRTSRATSTAAPRRERAMVLPGPALRLLRLGRHDRPDPARAHDRPVAARLHRARSPTCARSTCSGRPTRCVSQERLVPGQLRPLLDLMGVGDVVAAADGDRSRSGEPAPRARGRRRRGAAAAAAGPTPYGAAPHGPAPPARSSPPARLPQVRRWACRRGGIVRVLPRAPLTVVDGSAPALAGLSAFGALRTDRPLRYAADLGAGGDPRRPRAAADDRHLRLQPPPRLRRRAAAPEHRRDAARRPAAQRGRRDARPVPDARHRRPDRPCRSCAASSSARRLLAAGRRSSPSTARSRRSTATCRPRGWPTASLDRDRHHLDVTLHARRATSPFVDVCPYSDGRAVVKARARSTGGGSPCGAAGTALPVRLRGVREADRARSPSRPAADGASRRGRHPRAARPRRAGPRGAAPAGLAEHALRGGDLGRSSLIYLFDAHDRRRAVPARALHRRARGAGWLPRRAGRRARLARAPSRRPRRGGGAPTRGPASAPETPDRVLDRLGRRRPGRRRSTAPRASRALARNRASRAFDGDRGARGSAGWIAAARAWLQWRTRAAARRSGACASTPRACACAARRACACVADGARRPRRWRWRPTGRRRCRAPLRARSVPHGRRRRRASRPARPAPRRQRRAVGIGEVSGAASRAPPSARGGGRAATCPAASGPTGHGSARARCACAWLPTPGGDGRRPAAARAACGPVVGLPAAPLTVRAGPRRAHRPAAPHVGGAASSSPRRRRRPGARPRARRPRARATASASPSAGRRGSCSARASTAAGARECDGRASGRRRRCRATPTAGRSSAGAATWPSPGRRTARCSIAYVVSLVGCLGCSRCSSLRRRRARRPRRSLAPLPDGAGRAAWPLGRALLAGAARRRSCSASSSRCARAPSWAR